MKRVLSIFFIWVLVLSNIFVLTTSAKGEEREEVRACWVASVGNLDFPSDMGQSVAELKAEIESIVSHCRAMGLNTIFFQVRPMGDALYPSEVFPWSVYLSGKQGVPLKENFDPLQYFVETAHRAKIRLHGWINPYRIGAGNDVWSKLSSNNPAVLHPEYTVETVDGLYYNPGLPAVRNLILDGIAEIVENYDVDGIHFDDYFYPYNMEDFDDLDAYARYGKGKSLDDFRRESVDQLVKKAQSTIHSIRKDCQFGISPFGIWANRSLHKEGSDTNGLSSYAAIYSDSKKWVEKGWLDYICPQLYWTFDHEAAPYDVLVDWWDDLCTVNDTDLYIGLALHKAGTDEAGWDDPQIMKRELEYASKKKSYGGHCFFRYGAMLENPNGALDSVQEYYNSGREREYGSLKVLPSEKDLSFPSVSLKTADELKITSPADGAAVSASAISITGTAPAGQRVWVNNVEAAVNSYGLFSAYVPLKTGNNQITVSSNGQNKSINIRNTPTAPQTELSNAYPYGISHRGAGDVIDFYVNAPANSEITLKNEMISLPLYATEEHSNLYHGQWTVPALLNDMILDGFSYYCVLGDMSTQLSLDLQLHLYADGYNVKQVLQTSAYQFDLSREGSQMDHDPLPQGSVVYVRAIEGSRAQLETGFWVEQSTLGDQKMSPLHPLDYVYEDVIISLSGNKGYYTEFFENELRLTLPTGRRDSLKTECEHEDLIIDKTVASHESVLRIRSRSGRVLAGYEVYPQKNRLTVHLRYYSDTLKGKTIVLDAGHGGKDPGALSAGGTLYPDESDLNLSICQYLQEELRAVGANVVLLATTSEDLSLDSRVALAQSVAPDLFLSIHHNSTDLSADFNKSSGGLVLYSSPISEGLAKHLGKSMRDGVGDEDAECRRQSLRVCRQTRFPAVMLEVGYVCNPLEYELLCCKDIEQIIAKNIVESLNDYFVTVCS